MKINLYKSSSCKESVTHCLTIPSEVSNLFFCRTHIIIFNGILLNSSIINKYFRGYQNWVNQLCGDLISSIESAPKQVLQCKSQPYYLAYFRWYNNYAHYTQQIISPLIFAYYNHFINLDTPILHPPLNRFHKQILALLPFKNYIFLQDNVVYFIEKGIYNNSMNSNDVLTKKNVIYFEYLSKNICKQDNNYPNYIYIYRNVSRRCVQNKNDVLSFMKKNHIFSIDFASLSVIQQINYIVNAKKIIADHGASGANLIYTLNNFHFCEIFSESHITSYNTKICQFKNCAYSATINPNMIGYEHKFAPFFIDLDLLEYAIDHPICQFVPKKHDSESLNLIKFEEINKDADTLEESINTLRSLLLYNISFAYFAKTNLSKHNYLSALYYIQKAYEISPNNLEIINLYIDLLIHNKLYDNAYKLLLKLIKKASTSSNSYMEISMLDTKIKMLEESSLCK